MLSLVDLHSSWSSPGLVPLSGSRGARHHPQTQSGRTRSTHPHPSRFQPGVICVEEVPPSEGFPHHPSVRALTKAFGLYLLNSFYFETAEYGKDTNPQCIPALRLTKRRNTVSHTKRAASPSIEWIPSNPPKPTKLT